VVAADGALGGFSAAGGRQTKRRLLEIEGAAIAAQQPLFG
jgi:methylated-DNA-[protein]-cysteine S-methyltransferase